MEYCGKINKSEKDWTTEQRQSVLVMGTCDNPHDTKTCDIDCVCTVGNGMSGGIEK